MNNIKSVSNNTHISYVNFTGRYDKPVTTYEPEASSSLSDYSSAVSSYGKALVQESAKKPVKNDFETVLDQLAETKDNERISLDDAIKEFSTLSNLSDKNKCDYILACTYENDSPEPIINKKALLTTKMIILDRGYPSKLDDAVRTALNAEDETFDSQRFDSLFNLNGQVRRSARLKSKGEAKRVPKFQRKVAIMEAIEKQKVPVRVESDFKDKYLFTSLEQYQTDMLSDLDKLEDIPNDLKSDMQKSIKENNFDMKKTYSDYYSLLNECKTLDDVKMFYPELEYPKEKPEYQKSASYRTLSNRLAEEDFDGVVIDVLKKSYIDIKPKDKIFVHLEHSTPTNYRCLNNAGYKFSYPSQETLQFLDKADKLNTRFADMPDLDEENIKQLANKHAIRTSKTWQEYHDMTNSYWMPVRLIKHKRLHPDNSEYSTDKLVNTYLLQLYKQNKDADYLANPLAFSDEEKYISKPEIKLVNGIYMNRYKKTDEEVNNPDFIEFSNKFDKEAIGKSLEGLEDKYTTTFFRRYWTKERKNNLKSELQNANDLIYEKILLKEQISSKQVTDKDVQELIEEDLSIDIPQVGDSGLSKFRYTVANIKDKDLKERCTTCISNEENPDLGYFESINKILQQSTDKDGILNEDKAFVLVNLRDEYLEHLINDGETLSEDEFVSKSLAEYKDDSGEIDFAKAKKDFKAENQYYILSEQLMQKGQYDILSLTEEKFLTGKSDYNSANKVLGMYNSIPDDFKDKFVSMFQNKTKIRPEILLNDLGEFTKTISSWNYDKPEIIVMDKDKAPQKIVILPEAKAQLFETTGKNISLFDNYIKKCYQAATHRTGEQNGQGVKVLAGSDYDVELKIKGSGGNLRMYGRLATEEDKKLYETDDGISVKYVFYKHDDHL